MKSRTVLLCILCTLLFPALAVAEPEPVREADLSPPGSGAGDPLLEQLAAGVARALGSDTIRQRIVKELEASPYVEGRIALKRLLGANPDLRDELLWYADAAEGWEQMADSLPELELYFPVRAHRAVWRGDAVVQVAIPVSGSRLYRIFSTDGSRTTIDGTQPPTTPTLLLAPSEIDFDNLESALEGGPQTGSALRLHSTLDPAYAGDPTTARPFDRNLLTTKTSGVDTSRHTYLYRFYIPDDHDPLRGSMEIEFFGSVDGSYADCVRFTGIEEKVDYLAYMVESNKVAFAVPTGINTVDVKVYEDDDTGCAIKSGDDYLGVANLKIDDYGSFYATSNLEAWISVRTHDSTCGDSTCEGDESKYNCCLDCATCGDGVCSSCENGSSCPTDCYTCGNGICESSKGESYRNCSADCSSCGNGFCDPGEDYFSCPTDCCEGARICPE